jgi:hypothetical protein
MRRFQLLILISSVFLVPLIGQETKEATNKQVEDLRKEFFEFRSRIDSLKTMVQQSQPDVDDQMDRLSERLEKRITELETKVDAMGRSTAPVVFNPRTTAFINFAARTDNKNVLDASGVHEISDRPFLRTVELDLRAAVDPYAEAVAIISLENQAGKEYGVDAEEAFGIIKRLPILESAPMGLKLKIGKFRAPLGADNKMHMHDLPWTTRPLVVARYLGTEHGEFFESGYNPVGIDLDFFLPNPIPSTTLEMNADIVRGGELGLAQNHPGDATALIGHLNLSADWNNEHILVIGASGYHEQGMSKTNLGGIDFTYKWSPSVQRESNSIVLGGEAFLGNHTYEDPARGTITSNPLGWFAYSQYQVSYWLYLGLRYDQVQEPVNDNLSTKALSIYASYYTTEFLRFRLGFEHRTSDIASQNNLNSLNLEINFVYGSHPTEPYWVNR